MSDKILPDLPIFTRQKDINLFYFSTIICASISELEIYWRHQENQQPDYKNKIEFLISMKKKWIEYFYMKPEERET